MDTGASLYPQQARMMSLQSVRRGRLPVIHQAEETECALACLAMVLNFHGHKVDINTLRCRHRLSQHGITLKSLVTLSRNLELAARPLRLDLNDLGKLSLPAILHWNLNHYVVLKEVSGRGIEIHDPALGKKFIPWVQVSKSFTGVALELEPAAAFREKDECRKLHFSELWQHCGGIRASLFQLLLLSLLLQLFAIALPFYSQILLDDVLVNHDVELLKLLAIGFFLVVFFRQLTELVRSYVVLYISNKVSFHFATRLCRHLLHLPQEYFSRRHLGDIVSRFGSMNNLRDFLCSGIVEILVDGLMVTSALALMFYYSSSLTLIALVGVFLYCLVRFLTYKQLQERNEEWINDRALENSFFMENISAIQGIKLACREPVRIAAWQNRYVTSLNSGIRVQKMGINIQFAHGFLTGAENILILLAGSLAVIAGNLSIGMLIAFISFKEHFYRSVFLLVDKIFEFKVLDVHLSRLADIAYTEPELVASECSNIIPPLEKASPEPVSKVALENLSFRYSQDSDLLFQNVSLAISDTEKIAIVGPTGCGKSTLLKIVAGLVKPEAGRVCQDGRVVAENNLAYYRSKVAGVMQNDGLLSGSILENITFFDSMPDLDRACMVARIARIDQDITQMPMQYQTQVGAMGAALSGGQVQRILLARAIYQQPSLLILDEATSHLDIRTETAVNKELNNLAIPCLIVAHRPESVLAADKIYLLHVEGLRQIGHEEFRNIISKEHENDVITI